ncbi:MAG: STAS domain-containing protein [Gammaproteobacteria bacterium]|nr:MAG: STAS domain-containing protein [Gammaproteobacteria bacterium]
MKDFQIKPLEEGHFLLSGALTFDNVPAIWEETRALFSSHKRLTLDLGGIRHTTSAGLALLIEWLRLARSHNQTLAYVNVPGQMRALIEVSDLDRILPIENG